MAFQHPLLFPWDGPCETPGGQVLLDDETLRDGLQSPSTREPPLEAKKRYLHLVAGLGVAAVDLGMPAASPRVAQEVEALAREIRDHRLPLAPNCAVRTLAKDVLACAAISQRVGVKLEIMLFLSFSRLRLEVEGWERDFLLRKLEQVTRCAVREGLTVTFVAEDASRTFPEELQAALVTAARAGAQRVCLADTTGALAPWGAENLVRFARKVLEEHGAGSVQLDWHGHNDRGLAVACALAAARAGAHRLHGTLLGVGERTGNPPLEQLLANLALAGLHHGPIAQLVPTVRQACELLGLAVPAHAPVLGDQAFATATGVHAAAIWKAWEQQRQDLQELVYTPYPPRLFGGELEVLVGPYSGAANVRFWLAARGFPVTGELVQRVLGEAKRAQGILSEETLLELVQRGP